MVPSKALGMLREDGFEVFAGHAAPQIGDADLLVYSAAIPADNAERAVAGQRGIACASRAEVLGELSRWRRTVAVAGTHGKTTSAAMLAAVLRRAGLQPDILVGGWVDGRAHAETGCGEWLVLEADELLDLPLHEAGDGDARPSADHLGDVLLLDLLGEHAVLGLEGLECLLAGNQFALERGERAVPELGGGREVAGAFGTLSVATCGLDVGLHGETIQ